MGQHSEFGAIHVLGDLVILPGQAVKIRDFPGKIGMDGHLSKHINLFKNLNISLLSLQSALLARLLVNFWFTVALVSLDILPLSLLQYCFDCTVHMIGHKYELQCESKKSPLTFSDIFSQTVGNF